MSELHANHLAYLELQQQIQGLQAKADQLLAEGRRQAIEDVQQLIQAYTLRPEELGFAAAPRTAPTTRRDRQPKGAPRFRDPASGATWTGAGKPPNWIAGKSYDDFLIERTPAPADPVAAPAPVAANGAPRLGVPR